MKLQAHRVGGERPARQPRPLDRTLAFLDPLLSRAALVVEGDDALGRAAHVGYDEAGSGLKFARMPLYLGDHSARLGPASCNASNADTRQRGDARSRDGGVREGLAGGMF